MNFLNLQVRVKKIKIKTKQDSSLCFSLRLGRVLSVLSNALANSHNMILEPNIDLIIGCEDGLLNSNSRACLVIYEINSSQQRDIVGMVFITLKNQQGEVHRYKIQQCNDPTSFIELSFVITNLQVHEKQNQSLASKSSLAEIKQLHRVLSRGHKKSNSDHTLQTQELRKNRQIQQDTGKEKEDKNTTKVQHMKSQQTQQINNEQGDPSYAILMKQLRKQLAKQTQRNSVLTNLLVIEQTKNIESQNMLNKIINTLTTCLKSHDASFLLFENTQNHQQLLKQMNTNIQKNQKQVLLKTFKSELSSHENGNIQQSYKQKLDEIVIERNYLYNISQQLYEKTKQYKQLNQNLCSNIKNMENQLKTCVNEIQQLRQENKELKNKIFQSLDMKKGKGSEQSNKITQLLTQNQLLKQENIEYQRKFKQSYRAIQQFKNDAWKAQQQLILKDQQIATLKEDLQIAKMNSECHKQNQSKDFSSASYIKDQKQKLYEPFEAFKLMNALIYKNNLERNQILSHLKQNKQKMDIIYKNDTLILNLKDKMKIEVDKLYKDYDSNNTKLVHILEIRKSMMNIINSLSF